MHTDNKRRLFLKYLLTNGAMATAAGAGIMTPLTALAAWPKAAFEATSIPTALKTLLGNDKTTSKLYTTEIKARPHLGGGGNQITVSITTTIPDIDSITLLTTNNPTPLVASFKFGGKIIQSLVTRIKMEGKGEVIVILKSGDRLFSESASVDFSSCGCG